MVQGPPLESHLSRLTFSRIGHPRFPRNLGTFLVVEHLVIVGYPVCQTRELLTSQDLAHGRGLDQGPVCRKCPCKCSFVRCGPENGAVMQLLGGGMAAAALTGTARRSGVDVCSHRLIRGHRD